MKKITILSLILTIVSATCVCASEYTKFSKKFIKHFKDCDAYEETVVSEFEDNSFTTVRKIHGWKGGVCRYSEVITSKNESYRLNCAFAEIHVDDLYEAMKDRSNKAERYDLEVFKSKIDPKTKETYYVQAGSTPIKGNKAYITWAKYQNNPYICRSEKIK